MSANNPDEALYPLVTVGSKVMVWCLEFPPERRGNEIWTRLLEEVEVEIIDIEQEDHYADPALVAHLETLHGRKTEYAPWRRVLGKDATGREFLTSIGMQFPEKNRIEPQFFVPASIKSGGGSPEWWTPELFRRSGWHLFEKEDEI